MQLALDILQALADAVEYTYVQFEFQISSINTYRVLIKGGTKSDTIKYQTYGYYNRTRSYIDDIIPQILRDRIIDEIREEGYSCIKPWVDNISTEKSKAKLLVTGDALKLSGHEFYDGQCWLNEERRDNEYQMYIYTDEKSKICQKAIVYSNEKLTIVKRKPDILYYGGKTIELIEMIDALILENIDKDVSNVFWRVFEKALRNYRKNHKRSMKKIIQYVKVKNNIN